MLRKTNVKNWRGVVQGVCVIYGLFVPPFFLELLCSESSKFFVAFPYVMSLQSVAKSEQNLIFERS